MSIQGLKGREPIAAALTAGRKGPRGFPVDKDRFWLVAPRDVDGVRPPLPAFSFFNDAAPEHRRMVRGNLMHARKEDALTQNLAMRAFPKGYAAPRAHPNMRPVCSGDGVHAERWMQDEDGDKFTTIKCPHQHCEFRLMEPAACKPFSQLIFRIRWTKEGLPSPLVKFTSGGWETAANLLGFFEALEHSVASLGLHNQVLFGYPFILGLVERTNAKRKARYPVVTITPDVPDSIDFLIHQQQRLAKLGALPPPAAKLQSPEVIYEDIQSINIPME